MINRSGAAPARSDREAPGTAQTADGAATARPKTGLDDPRALEILTAEHWSLLSTRTLGYQEMFARSTIFIAVLSAIFIALALLAQATHFGRETLLVALVLITVALFVGLTTFVRSVAINFDDARWVNGMNLLRQAYLQMVPELKPFFVTGHTSRDEQSLGYGSLQRRRNLANSLTTTSSVVAALNSILAGGLASAIAALFTGGIVLDAILGTVVSLASAVLHVRYAARFRERQRP
jgi:hypothetical protein